MAHWIHFTSFHFNSIHFTLLHIMHMIHIKYIIDWTNLLLQNQACVYKTYTTSGVRSKCTKQVKYKCEIAYISIAMVCNSSVKSKPTIT